MPSTADSSPVSGTVTATPPRASSPLSAEPARSTVAASWLATRALVLRDLVVLRKNLAEFIIRTLVQP